jgi:hypothetical protein
MAEAKKPTKTTTPGKSAKRSTPNTAPATPPYASKYTVGDQISHPMFGAGDGNPYQQTDHRVSSQHHQTDRRRLRDARALIESDIHR